MSIGPTTNETRSKSKGAQDLGALQATVGSSPQCHKTVTTSFLAGFERQLADWDTVEGIPSSGGTVRPQHPLSLSSAHLLCF